MYCRRGVSGPQNGESVSSVGLLNSIKQAYIRTGIYTAPRGTWLYRVHQMVKASYFLAQPGRRYDQDGLRSIHNHDFMSDPAFVRAYQRGVQAASDYHWHWRVHVGLWAARLAVRLPGDFVECGTNRGFLSSAIMKDLDWDKTGRRFYLLDTFSGRAERFVSVEEKKDGVLDRNGENWKAVSIRRASTRCVPISPNGKMSTSLSVQFPKLWSKLIPSASPFYILT
jgi:hypothetical protein